MKINIEQKEYEKPSMVMVSIDTVHVICLSGETDVDETENAGETEFGL